MSEYICSSEWVVLFLTQNRRMTADKWIRSVTVTVASGAPIHRMCVYEFVSRAGSEWSLCTSWCCVDLWPHIHRHMYTPFFVLRILSLQTQPLSSFYQFALFLYCEIMINKQIYIKLICKGGVLTSSCSVRYAKTIVTLHNTAVKEVLYLLKAYLISCLFLQENTLCL